MESAPKGILGLCLYSMILENKSVFVLVGFQACWCNGTTQEESTPHVSVPADFFQVM